MIGINHLPAALHHYERELRQCAPDVTAWVTVAGEAGGSRLRQLHLGLEAIARLRAIDDDVLRLWPLFGLRELSLSRAWRHSGKAWWQVVHDPVPLEREAPAERWLAMWSSLAQRDDSCRYIVHSTDAVDLLMSAGVSSSRLSLLPHPVLTSQLPRQSVRRKSRPSVVCLGSFKGVRDLALMRQLPRVMDADFDFYLMGKGWPEVPGWRRRARHLSEAEFDLAIASASVVVVPYERFFQSNVMVRALESGVPCVAPRNAFSEGLAGPDWCGLVRERESHESWDQAIRRAACARVDWQARLPTYQASTVHAYAQWWASSR